MTPNALAACFTEALQTLNPADPDYVPHIVDLLLDKAREQRASDIHLIPSEDQLQMQWRIDGVLHSVAAFEGELKTRIIARLKVTAGLLTYRTDVPQEGRISNNRNVVHGHQPDPVGSRPAADTTINGEVRITTFPTLFGEKAAVRLFADSQQFQLLHDLGLPTDVEDTLRQLLQQTSGVILLTGPSGSGKTTTVYACLRELVRLFGESKGLMTLEDPIEVVVPGVTQSQIRPNVGFDLASGLKSMMRQDPDVIMVGEIRDPETAECAFQAALTGHLVITTFHAGSSVQAITRLLDMGIEPYLLRSTLQTVVCQRLLRQACPDCWCAPTGLPEDSGQFQNFPKSSDKSVVASNPAVKCSRCGGLRFLGRFVTAEMLVPSQPQVSQAILDRVDADQLQHAARECGTVLLRDRCERAVLAGLTYPEEVFRVLGRNC